MYLSHYGLQQPPFSITPNPAFFYTGNKRGAILDALIYAIVHGEGIVKVTGEVGSGKTMLCRMLESLLPQNIEVIYLVNPTLGRENVVYAIAGELGLATEGKRADEVIRILQNDLIEKHATGKQVVLLIEEAQAMPLETLEEIRLFSNLETAHHKLLQIVLFGQPELDENLNLPHMRQLKERITHSFKVPPLEPAIIPEYLMFRMRAAGYHGPDIFSKQAIKHIAAVSEGIVRRVSILADKALLAAFADNTHAIQARHVKAAIEDSEFSATAQVRRRRHLLILLLAASALAGAALTWHFSRPAASPSPSAEIATPTVTAAAPVAPQVPLAAKSAAASTSIVQTPQLAPRDASASAAAPLTPKVSATGLLQQRLENTRAWLNMEDRARYTVQIALTDAVNLRNAEQALLARDAEVGSGQIHVFPTKIGGMPRFGFTYGSYVTRAEANAAITKLTSERGYRPQLRTIDGIRQEIERTQSADLWQ